MRKAVGVAARIAAVADAFDSLTHKRAYRKAFGVTEAIDMIKKAGRAASSTRGSWPPSSASSREIWLATCRLLTTLGDSQDS